MFSAWVGMFTHGMIAAAKQSLTQGAVEKDLQALYLMLQPLVPSVACLYRALLPPARILEMESERQLAPTNLAYGPSACAVAPDHRRLLPIAWPCDPVFVFFLFPTLFTAYNKYMLL